MTQRAELSIVTLARDVHDNGLRFPAGMQGTIVFVYPVPGAYMIDFGEPINYVADVIEDDLVSLNEIERQRKIMEAVIDRNEELFRRLADS
jgi:hypothetical protein